MGTEDIIGGVSVGLMLSKSQIIVGVTVRLWNGSINPQYDTLYDEIVFSHDHF